MRILGTDPVGKGLKFVLLEGPEGSDLSWFFYQVDSWFRWRPTEEQGPGTYNVRIQILDGAEPPGEAFVEFQVQVREVNESPSMPFLFSMPYFVGEEISIPVKATDPDVPANRLTYSLGYQFGDGTARMDGNVFRWKPTKAGSFQVEIVVTDDGGPEGAEPRQDSDTFSLDVREKCEPAEQVARMIALGAQLSDALATLFKLEDDMKCFLSSTVGLSLRITSQFNEFNASNAKGCLWLTSAKALISEADTALGACNKDGEIIKALSPHWAAVTEAISLLETATSTTEAVVKLFECYGLRVPQSFYDAAAFVRKEKDYLERFNNCVSLQGLLRNAVKELRDHVIRLEKECLKAPTPGVASMAALQSAGADVEIDWATQRSAMQLLEVARLVPLAADALSSLDKGELVAFRLRMAEELSEYTESLIEGTAGPGAGGGAVSRAHYHVRAVDGSFEARGRTTEDGRVEGLILAPEAVFEITYLEPGSYRTARALFKSGANGSRTPVPPALFLNELARLARPDSDGDGLPDEAEGVLGTSIQSPDTDGDGVADRVELEQATDPLDGQPVSTGVIAAADTAGEAVDVAALNDLVAVADGPGGVVLFDVADRKGLTRLAQVPVPGGAWRVAFSDGWVLAADGQGGVVAVDVSDPPVARGVRIAEVGGNVTALAAGGGLAFAGNNLGVVTTIDVASGTVLDRLRLPEAVADLVLSGDHLFALTHHHLHVLGGLGEPLSVLGSVASPTLGIPNARLAVVGGVAYATHGRGANTFDVSNPRAPVLAEAGVTPQFGWKQLVPNGSGLGVGAVDPNLALDGPNDVWIYDLAEPGKVGGFLTAIPTPGIARALSIYNGLAYVADGTAGLQVLNYRAFDTAGRPPTISLDASFEILGESGGAESGRRARVTASVADDVQVRAVEFYVDRERVTTDGNAPFEHRFAVPTRSADRTNFTLQARAMDTGGNFTWSPLVTVAIVPDATPPGLVDTFPRSGAVVGAVDTVMASFSEPIDPLTLVEGVVQVRGAGGDGVLGTGDDIQRAGTLGYRDALDAVFLSLASPLSAGAWEVVLRRQFADMGGNQPAQDFLWRFWVVGGLDADQDGIPDGVESAFGYDRNRPDSDGDGALDGEEDWDGDGIPNAWEIAFGLDPLRGDGDDDGTPDGDEDPDLDTLSTRREFLLGTSPIVADSDGDGWNDEAEVTGGSGPLDPRSIPFRWVGSTPPVRVAVSRGQSGQDYALGTVVARPPVSVAVTRFEGSLGSMTVLAAPPVRVSVSRGVAGQDYFQGTTIARPPVSVALTRFDASLGPFTAVASPPVRVALSRGVAGQDYVPGTTVARPPVRAAVLEGVVNPANGHRYYLLPPGTWAECEAQAVQLGGHLVTLDDQAEQDWVVATFATSGPWQRDLWCGLRDPDTAVNAATPEARRAEFQWVSGSPGGYQNWYPGQPDRYLGLEYFTLLISAQNNSWAQNPNWRWNDAPATGWAHGVAEVAP